MLNKLIILLCCFLLFFGVYLSIKSNSQSPESDPNNSIHSSLDINTKSTLIPPEPLLTANTHSSIDKMDNPNHSNNGIENTVTTKEPNDQNLPNEIQTKLNPNQIDTISDVNPLLSNSHPVERPIAQVYEASSPEIIYPENVRARLIESLPPNTTFDSQKLLDKLDELEEEQAYVTITEYRATIDPAEFNSLEVNSRFSIPLNSNDYVNLEVKSRQLQANRVVLSGVVLEDDESQTFSILLSQGLESHMTIMGNIDTKNGSYRFNSENEETLVIRKIPEF